MTLLEEAREVQTSHGPLCQVAAIRSTSSASFQAELDELLEAVRAKRVYATTASKILKSHQVELNERTIRRHRDGECKCR